MKSEKKRSNDAVADIVGTVMMLGIAVSLIAMVYISVLSYPFTPSPISADLIGSVDGNNIIIEHHGGDSLSLSTEIAITVGGSTTRVTVEDYLDDESKEDGLWNIGERVVYSDETLTGLQVKAVVVDVKSNSAILMGILQEGLQVYSWIQTSHADFEVGTLVNVNTSSSPGDVKLASQIVNTLTEEDSLTFTSGNKAKSAVIDITNGYAYFASDDINAIITKIRLSDFTEVDTLTLTSFKAKSAVIDTTNGFAYFGSDDNPAKVAKIQLSDFTHDSTLTLTGFNKAKIAVIDTSNGYAYFASDENPAEIAKVKLSDFTYDDNLTLTGCKKPKSAVIDTSNGYAYFGSDNDPAKVAKIQLSDFTHHSTLTLSTGNKAKSAVIDTNNGYAYFGTDDTNGKVIKVKIFGTQFYSSGNLTSSIKDCSSSATITQVNWSETLNSQTITMQIRSDDNSDMSSPSSWETVTNGDTTISTPANRYIQYKATLSTLDISATPVLHDVTIRYY